MNKVYAKVMLFGEYSVITGSDALVVPFRKYSAILKFSNNKKLSKKEKWSNRELKGYAHYLASDKRYLLLGLDINRLNQDIENGLVFQSTIPEKCGLGSSGALVSGIFRTYGSPDEINIDLTKLKKKMALAENHFHGNSSGIDPLAIYIGKPVYIQTNQITVIGTNSIAQPLHQFYLFDTKSISETGRLVNKFNIWLSASNFKRTFSAYAKIVDAAIQSMLAGDHSALQYQMAAISEFQFTHLKEMIPLTIRDLWQQGLASGEFLFKLCGSGGGGFMILFLTGSETGSVSKFRRYIESLNSYL
jgi:mevalonate kinase